MVRITLFIPYYGAFPNYFQLYLNSLAKNQDVLTVVLVTDIDLSPYSCPPNLRVHRLTFLELRLKLQAFLHKTYNKLPSFESVCPRPYKLCDFKIMFPLLFSDISKDTWDTENDFVGWGDIDIIYGKLSQFVNKEPYNVIGGWHGHFTAIQNTDLLKNLFLQIPDLCEFCLMKESVATDEIAFGEHLKKCIEQHNLKLCYLNASFCDIVPPVFYEMFRNDHSQYVKNFFNVSSIKKNISFLKYENGRLTTRYDDLETKETSYVHLQKMSMSIHIDLNETDFYITSSAFQSHEPIEPPVIPNNLFLTWHTKDMPPRMKENLERIQNTNLDMNVRFYDMNECREFLATHFPPAILNAYDTLKPIAYKADLWRLCILYMYGGIYLDIKLRPVDYFTFSSLLTREYWVSDGEFRDHNNNTLNSIYNALIVSKANNPALLKAILTIVFHVSRRYSGYTPYDITGPQMLSYIYKTATKKEPLYLSHVGPKSNERVLFGTNVILDIYKEYREEVPPNANYYREMWKARTVYEDNIKHDTDTTEWSEEMTRALDDIKTEWSEKHPRIRIHVPAIPYTITNSEFSHDAFTGLVQRFSPMMRSVINPTTNEPVYEIYHYGVETSESGADRDIQLFTKEEWQKYRVESLQFLQPSLSTVEAVAKLNNEKSLVGFLANCKTPLYKEFNKRFKHHLIQYYRKADTDIVGCVSGQSYNDSLNDFPGTVIETAIGYKLSCRNFRIFASHAWLSHELGTMNKDPSNYWFVVHHGFNVAEFKFYKEPSAKRKIGYLGRVIGGKGCFIIAEIAKRFLDVEFVLCGQGDPSPFLTSPNISYRAPIHGEERSAYLGSFTATLCPTQYFEPFGCSAVESQLCGTPVISCDTGGYVETVEQFKSGLRCHTLADYCKGVEMALNGYFDRSYIRDRAVRLFDMYAVAKQYDYVFKSILDISKPGKNGWYSSDCHLAL